MKKHHLILGSTVLFSLLFYKEEVGVNLSVFAIALLLLIFISFKEKSQKFKILLLTSFLSILAFAWYGDFVSFLALFFSLFFLQFQNQDHKLKEIQCIPIVFINAFTTLGRPFIFGQWLPEMKIGNSGVKKIIAYFLIPCLFLVMFFITYCFGSETFSSLFEYELDLDVTDLILIAIFGFYVSFSFWNYWIPDYFINTNQKLDNDFTEESKQDFKASFSFLDIDFERKSGEISLILLNLMLLIFIITYNYEQFFKISPITSLSSATHDRVNAVIISIIMAVGVILFYFKKEFIFDLKATLLKILAKIWIGLNAVLIISSAIKNSEYIIHYGMTYKRIGVYAFLGLTLVGLIFVYIKINKQKTNAYLFNQMIWCLYGLLLICSFFNWGNLITNYNIEVNKGVDPVFLSKLNYNDQTRRAYFELHQLDGQYNEVSREENIYEYKKRNFLSKVGYYECLNNK